MSVLPRHEQVDRRAEILRLTNDEINNGNDDTGNKDGERGDVETNSDRDSCKQHALRDYAEDDVSAPTIDWECVFGEARVALFERSILDFESLAIKIFES